MHKLTGIDATFLYLETQRTPMHIAGLAICQPPKDYAENPFQAFRAQIASRLHEIPSFSRVLAPIPFGIDHPVWVTADKIDLDYHIRRAALPTPGDWPTLRRMVEHLHSQVLDRTRPLWQYHVIEGLEGGRFALYLKSHHACIDGGAGILAMDILSDTVPTPRPPFPVSEVTLPTRKPGFFQILGAAYGNMIQQQVDLIKAVPDLAKTVGNIYSSLVDKKSWSLGDLKPAPKTIFNARVARQRAYGTSTIAMSEARAVGKKIGATLNDVVLTICGGALRRYLQHHKALPAESLVAAVPVSLREVGDTSDGNQVTSVFARFGTDIDSPLKRVAAVKSSMGKAKAQLGDIRKIVPQDFNFFGAPAILTGFWQLMERTSTLEQLPPMMNLAISNVPGPRKPMYFAGCEVTEYYPVSICTHGSALNITLHSYVDRLDFGLTACKTICPDVQMIADLLVEEFGRLKAEVAALEQAGPEKAAAATEKPAKQAAKPAKAVAAEAPAAAKPARKAPAKAKKAAPRKQAASSSGASGGLSGGNGEAGTGIQAKAANGEKVTV